MPLKRMTARRDALDQPSVTSRKIITPVAIIDAANRRRSPALF